MLKKRLTCIGNDFCKLYFLTERHDAFAGSHKKTHYRLITANCCEYTLAGSERASSRAQSDYLIVVVTALSISLLSLPIIRLSTIYGIVEMVVAWSVTANLFCCVATDFLVLCV